MNQTSIFQYIAGLLLCCEFFVFGGVVPLEEDRLPLASTVEEFLTTDDNHPDLLWTNPRKLNNEWIRNRSPVYRYHSIYDPSFQQMNSNKETNFENLAPHWQTMRANKRLEWPEEVPRHKKIPENEIWATPVIPGDPSDLRKPRMVLRRSYEVGSHQKFDEDYAGESSSRRHTGVEGRHSNLDRHAEDYITSRTILKSDTRNGEIKIEEKENKGNQTRALEKPDNRIDNIEAQRKLRELVSLIWKLHH